MFINALKTLNSLTVCTSDFDTIANKYRRLKSYLKYLRGLKDGQAFFLTTRIYDTLGNYEQIFVRVSAWEKESVSGTIANQLNAVKGFSYGQTIIFPESDILDWLITNPDGSEEGNFVGKYLDTIR